MQRVLSRNHLRGAQEEHQIEGEDAEVDLGEAAGLRSRAEIGIEEALELREHAFDLPSLAEPALGEPAVHLTPVSSLRWAGMAAEVDRKDGQADSEFAATDGVKVFGVVRGISEESVQTESSRGVSGGLREIGRIVAGAAADDGRGDQVGGIVADDRGLQEGADSLHSPPLTREEVAADVVGFEAGGVDGTITAATEPSDRFGVTEDGVEEGGEGSFFRRRCSAFWSVVKWGTLRRPRAWRRSDHSARVRAIPR